MNTVTSSLGAIVFASVALFSARSWWVEREVQELTRPESGMHAVSAEALLSAPHDPLRAATVDVALFERFAAQAAQAPSIAEQGRALCAALSHIGAALNAEPMNSKFLINWANARQTLGATVHCEEPFTSGSFEAATAYAIKSDPTNVEVRFAAARIFDWAGNRAEALANFHQVLASAVRLQPEQKALIFRYLNTPSDLTAVIPDRFPQVAEWSERLRQENPDLFRRARVELTSLQMEAIRNSGAELEQRRISADLHERRLFALYSACASPQVRSQLDQELYGIGMRDRLAPELSEYLRARSTLAETDVVLGWATPDTRPLKTPFVNWNPQSEACLDDFYPSLGFYLPEGESPKLLEIRAADEGGDDLSALIKVYVSEDNSDWSELQGNLQIRSLVLGNSRLIAIRPSTGYFKYWKINFGIGSRTKRFCNVPRDLLRVYRTLPEGNL